MIDKFWSEVIQLTGVIFLVIGLLVEVHFGADIGYVILTGGSLVFALGTKYKHAKENDHD